jgi:hypothetical protein
VAALAFGKARLLFQEGVDRGLGDGFVYFRFGAAGSDGADGLAVDLNGQAALVGEVVRKGKGFDIALFHVVGGVFRGAAVKGGVAGFLLGPHDGVEGGGIGFLEEKEIAAFVHDADGDFDIAFFGFRFGGGDHGLDGGEIDIFFGWQIGGGGSGHKSEHNKKEFEHGQDATPWDGNFPFEMWRCRAVGKNAILKKLRVGLLADPVSLVIAQNIRFSFAHHCLILTRKEIGIMKELKSASDKPSLGSWLQERIAQKSREVAKTNNSAGYIAMWSSIVREALAQFPNLTSDEKARLRAHMEEGIEATAKRLGQDLHAFAGARDEVARLLQP